MSRYQHTKGQIKDNAIEALLHDPLFRQRVEKTRKGKEAINVKINMQEEIDRGGQWQASESLFTTGLLLSLLIKNGCFVLSADREFAQQNFFFRGLAVPPEPLLSYDLTYSSI